MNSLFDSQYLGHQPGWDPPAACQAPPAPVESNKELTILDINHIINILPDDSEVANEQSDPSLALVHEIQEPRSFFPMASFQASSYDPYKIDFDETHEPTTQSRDGNYPSLTQNQMPEQLQRFDIHQLQPHQIQLHQLQPHHIQVQMSMEQIASSDQIYLDNSRLRSSNEYFGQDATNIDLLDSILISNAANMSEASSSSNSQQPQHNSKCSMFQLNESFLNQCSGPLVASSNSPVSSGPKVNRKSAKKMCSVCGNESSGYHYGSHTCEACKLFFRRTEKKIRKTGFTECQKKNCQITSLSRANCSQCRYKKCIAAGMSMGRSRYGRHTEPEVSQYQPNITDSLHQQIDQLKVHIIQRKLTSFEMLNDLILDFYIQSINLLKVSEHDETDSNGDPLQSMKSFQQKLLLPRCIILLFCYLFDINVEFLCNPDSTEILDDYKKFFEFIKQKVLHDNEFVLMLKIGLYLKVLRVLFETELLREDLIDKRINDLMRSEFAMFNKYNSTKEAPCLAMLFSQMNHILFKHMTDEELDIFLRLF